MLEPAILLSARILRKTPPMERQPDHGARSVPPRRGSGLPAQPFGNAKRGTASKSTNVFGCTADRWWSALKAARPGPVRSCR